FLDKRRSRSGSSASLTLSIAGNVIPAPAPALVSLFPKITEGALGKVGGYGCGCTMQFGIYAHGHKVQKASEDQSTSDVGLGLVLLLRQLLLRPSAAIEQQSECLVAFGNRMRSMRPGGMNSAFSTVVLKFKKRVSCVSMLRRRRGGF